MTVYGIEYSLMILVQVVTWRKDNLYHFQLTCSLSNFIELKELNIKCKLKKLRKDRS